MTVFDPLSRTQTHPETSRPTTSNTGYSKIRRGFSALHDSMILYAREKSGRAKSNSWSTYPLSLWEVGRRSHVRREG
ncbi:uncharacterized protein LY79DRAFT_13239 [Colletotrichum navitas]|uniref:Uncharacterized protein n=1 Tax=Colletotrichum navitas TaxID=681940 RepID=A0AAD8QFP2_9PEZI|nr:uncharacterized protein LY79DRAFT_13239 [Colletotrichum navitas]KAK1600284.1 hypothetical protein LY79DRAFT_13239 [Colletotrichum navitas]